MSLKMNIHMSKVLIIGEHPIKEHILEQYKALGMEILTGTTLASADEYVFLTTTAEEERAALVMLSQLPLHIAADSRPRVHLLLQSQETLHLLRTRDYCDEWHEHFELCCFTLEDVWAKRVVCGEAHNDKFPGLDHRPVMLESQHVVHFVVVGLSALATSLAEHAALVAHFPNYTRDHSLRTRITIIDPEVTTWSQRFVSTHKALMDNSFYRTIDVGTETCHLHRPMYEGRREDFVDVEWEFVRGSIHDLPVQDKLQGWAEDERKVLSVAVCHDSDEQNLSETAFLAPLLSQSQVPVYMKQSSDTMASIMQQSSRMNHVRMIGMTHAGYDVTQPLLRMAQRVNYVYCTSSPSYIDDHEASRLWLGVKKAIKRHSNVCNAMTLSTKMRSLGHTARAAHTFYAITRQEVDIIAEVEHNRWSVEEMLQGYRPCTDEEQALIEADISLKGHFRDRLIHYDLRAYHDLRPDASGQNVSIYDRMLSSAIPLIAFTEEKSDE